MAYMELNTVLTALTIRGHTSTDWELYEIVDGEHILRNESTGEAKYLKFWVIEILNPDGSVYVNGRNFYGRARVWCGLVPSEWYILDDSTPDKE